jgi:endoglucanase
MRMATRLATAPLLMLLALPLTAEQPATGRAPLSGVNIAGGEFNSARRPGVFGKDYIYPDAKTARPFIDMGMQIVRVPILWERAQPTPLQPLSKTEMALIDKSLASLAPFRTIVLDVHNYGRYNGQRLDQISNGSIMLADLWQRLAEHYKGDGAIAFGLMNEPFGMTPAAWRSLVDRSVAAIRRTGAANLILVPGSKYSGAHSWTAGGSNSNALAFANFRDPGSNYAFEMHQYLDTDSSGTGTNCVSPDLIDARLASATTWLRANGHRGYLGEFGVPPNDNCLHGLDILLTHLHANSDVWMGWTYWAAGAWWGTRYPMSVQPIDGPRPQAAILHKYIFAREPR